MPERAERERLLPDLPDIFNGCKIFPCVAGGKHPLTDRGWHDATDDPAQIEAWEKQYPGCNWAVATGLSGLFVIDVDPEGIATWEAMQNDDPELKAAIARSYTVRTPRAGTHHYFRGEGPSTASRIAEGIDTRGGMLIDGKVKSGGYVLLPGSRTSAGTYTELGGTIRALPAVVAAVVPERKKAETHGLAKDPDKDQPRNVKWAIDLLQSAVQSGDVSIMGKGGNDKAFQIACRVMDKAISPSLCYDLLVEHWNPSCSPPWDDWELERIVRNASEYGEDTGGGSKGFQANSDAFAGFLEANPGAGEAEEKRRRFQPMWLKDARKDRKPARWLIPNLLPAEGTGILYGLTGSYKTFVALDWSLCLAHGVAGQWGAPPVRHKVLFLAGESSYALRQERVDAWCEVHELDPDDSDFIFVHGVPSYSDSEGWTEIRDGLAEMGVTPDLVVIDTLTREMTGLDENSNNDGKLVLKFNEELAAHYGCMVLAVGHTGKDQGRGLRGAQVFMDNSDAVLFLKKRTSGVALTPKKLKEVDCDGEPIYLQVKEAAKSIVLERVEELPQEAKQGKTRTDWASPAEVSAVLNAHGGSLSFTMLAQNIAAKTGVALKRVKDTLSHSEELKWMHSDGQWSLPTKQEYDL